jgi:integrase/recombinase XerD
MSLGRQAKVLSKGQLDAALGLLVKSRYPARHQVILLLSSKAGLRAKEIARLRWTMVIDAEGELSKAISLDDNASKWPFSAKSLIEPPERASAGYRPHDPTVSRLQG